MKGEGQRVVLHEAGHDSDRLRARCHDPATAPRGNPWPGVRPWLLTSAAAVSLRDQHRLGTGRTHASDGPSLPVLAAAWAWVPLGFALPARGRMRQIAVLLLGLALKVGPWTLRNAFVLHAFVPVATGATQGTAGGHAEEPAGVTAEGPRITSG